MNTGGPASEKTLRDEFAGRALAGLCSSWYDRHKDDPETQRGHGPTLISQSAYTHAEAMLAEKARREWQMKSAMEKPGVVECVAALCRDHSGDANKMAELQAANRELVEFVERLAAFPLEEFGWQDRKDSQPIHGWNDYTLHVSDIKRARNLVSKHKGDA